MCRTLFHRKKEFDKQNGKNEAEIEPVISTTTESVVLVNRQGRSTLR